MESHYKHIRVRPKPHGFGAEITGLSISKPLPAAVLEEVNQAWPSSWRTWRWRNRLSWSLEGGSKEVGVQMLHRSKILVSHFCHHRLVPDTPCPVGLCGPPSPLVSETNQTLYP